MTRNFEVNDGQYMTAKNGCQIKLFRFSADRHRIRPVTDFTALPRLGYTAPQVKR
jgi:hypothetical protein